jgi:hypothetical protein
MGEESRSVEREDDSQKSRRQIDIERPRFVAEHRGEPLDRQSHIFLARWAADYAERVLLFTRTSDDRPIAI